MLLGYLTARTYFFLPSTAYMFDFSSLICYTFDVSHFSRLKSVNLKSLVFKDNFLGDSSIILAVNEW